MDANKKFLSNIERYLHAHFHEAGNTPSKPAPREGVPPANAPAVKADEAALREHLSTHAANHRIARILVAIDHPDHAAINAALALARPLHAEVAVVFVLDNTLITPVDVSGDFPQTEEGQRAMAQHLLRTIEASLPPNERAFTVLREGDPATEIVAAAKEFDAGLIVIGTHRRGALARFFLGSVSHAVVRRSHCPVLLVTDAAPVEETIPSHPSPLAVG
jgi:nucleotide-binding universal stress UspA family protein